MSHVSIKDYSGHLERSAMRTLDTLDKLEERMSGQFASQRTDVRKPFRGHATIVFPDPENPVLTMDAANSCKVWARSISSGGMSFIYPNELAQGNILVGLEITAGDPIWFQAEIVRVKEVPEEDFWVYGVAFRERIMM